MQNINLRRSLSAALLVILTKIDAMKRRFVTAIMAAAIALMSSCSSDSDKAKLKVYFTDAPGNFESVMVDVQSVSVHYSGTDESGWISLEGFQPGAFNVLDFTNGIDTLLASAELSAGKISQIRLLLGENNSVTVDGETHPLTVPSGYTSGLKLNIHQDFKEGVTYKIWLDFDAGRSIVKTGSGSYILKPVIRTFADATSGAIKGFVEPKAARPHVMAILGNDTLGTIADTSGYFMIKGVPTGEYLVKFVPVEGYSPKEIDIVRVVLGEINDLGVVELETSEAN